jgi:hypothetical protein
MKIDPIGAIVKVTERIEIEKRTVRLIFSRSSWDIKLVVHIGRIVSVDWFEEDTDSGGFWEYPIYTVKMQYGQEMVIRLSSPQSRCSYKSYGTFSCYINPSKGPNGGSLEGTVEILNL